ncbi:MAG TPA: hypothetical protein PKZ76_13380 [Xanthomonadaceae bacterium]|nr:hypothetical protein [Xanthomonadaceae bacterium]
MAIPWRWRRRPARQCDEPSLWRREPGPVRRECWAWGTPIASLPAPALSTALTLALAAMRYNWVERPLMGWGRHRT